MLGTATAYVTHGTYFLKHADRLPPTPNLAPQQGSRLLFPDTSGEGGISVVTGTFDGPVSLIVETYDAVPADGPDGEWEQVEELALQAAGHDLTVTTLSGLVEALPSLVVVPGARYGVRVSARGLEVAADVQELDLDDEPLETHFVQLWPVPAS